MKLIVRARICYEHSYASGGFTENTLQIVDIDYGDIETKTIMERIEYPSKKNGYTASDVAITDITPIYDINDALLKLSLTPSLYETTKRNFIHLQEPPDAREPLAEQPQGSPKQQ